MVSDEQAKNSVRQFLGTIERDAGFPPERIRDLLGTATPDQSPNVGPMWTFKSTFGIFWVAQRTGEVVFYAAPEASTNGAPRINPQAADAAALRFIRAVYKDFDKRNFKLVKKKESDDEVVFDFEEAPAENETSIFPNSIAVWVDASRGRVMRYEGTNLPFKRTTPPRISESEARRMIEAIIASRKGVIETLRLFEEPVDGAARSVTVWSADVVLQAGPFKTGERVVINADTGEQIKLE
jgi:hypothetical protein